MSIDLMCPLDRSMRHAVGATRAYFTPILLLTGVTGNVAILTIFIMEARLTRWNRFGIYGSALAVSDAGVLLVSGFLDDFLGRGLTHAFGRPVVPKLDALNSASCKSLEFLQNYFLFVSSHLLLAFTLDRLLGVWRPLRFAVRSYLRATVLVVAGICLAGLVLTAPVAAVYDVDGEVARGCHLTVSCNSTNGRSLLVLAKFTVYYKGFGVFVVPFLLQACLCAALVWRLLRIRRSRQELLSGCGVEQQRMEMSRFYANLALSLASCLLVAPLCVAIVMRAGCGLCAPRGDCRCRYLQQLTKLLDSLQDASFAAPFWVYLACVRPFRRRVAFAMAVVFVRGGLAARCPSGWAPVRRAEELLAQSERRRRPGAYVAAEMRQQLLSRGSSCCEGSSSSRDRGEKREVQLHLLAQPALPESPTESGTDVTDVSDVTITDRLVTDVAGTPDTAGTVSE